jgi:hypothetical protein
MDQCLNPYTPGSGVKPLKLAGRDGDLEAFGVLLERLAGGQPERSLIYSGLRGVGKTVLLLEFETLARESGWVCNDVEEVGSRLSSDLCGVGLPIAAVHQPPRADARSCHRRVPCSEGVLSGDTWRVQRQAVCRGGDWDGGQWRS